LSINPKPTYFGAVASQSVGHQGRRGLNDKTASGRVCTEHAVFARRTGSGKAHDVRFGNCNSKHNRCKGCKRKRMNSRKAKILVVDDDPTLIDMHSIYLEDEGYETLTADNGKQALDILQEDSGIDLVLSDVMMPEMNGYEFCKAAKAQESLKDIPFVFVSSLTTLDEKVKGFEAGGDDYVPKPIAPEEMIRKVSFLIDMRSKQKELQKELNESYKAAMSAMSYSSDLGRILEFFNSSLVATSFEQLAKSLFEFTGSFGLKATIQYLTPDGSLSFSSSGKPSPLETNVIELARQETRFFDFDARTIISYDDFSLLIKNMPLEDKEKYGQLKDTLGTLCNAIEAKVKNLLVNDINRQKNEILATVQQVLEEVDKTYDKIQHSSNSAILDMMDEIDNAIMHLGLMEYQEEDIRKIASGTLQKTNKIFEEGRTLNDKFAEIRNKLNHILNMTS
jgi:CheY-like chemotaxis protein